ncbi:hypothetical protein TNIN_31691 [Trichonephila inaurata madagascariensis]|uniref:Uncharacterized protein n=1 Tax=Trichonephila inaurata madagascariensis TaxID=2747483 RepID=A0A8X7CRJ3_9ARAC|nr:hypothetical protein TNIN_31691 [Trichonephila inaurata madagascariensis]
MSNTFANDEIIECEADRAKERAAREKLHTLSTIDTGGLPYAIIFFIDKPYITANIDVTDGSANGAVALSRVTAQEGLHIVHTDKRQRFYYGTRNNEAILPLRNEFTRLSTVHLTTIDQTMINKMNGGYMILFFLNCQSQGICP